MKRVYLALVYSAALCHIAFGQTGTFQAANPHYPVRNPFYFEGKIDYEKLGIDQPRNAWEFMQRGMHLQDDLEDLAGAVADYRESVRLNDFGTGAPVAGTCQIVTSQVFQSAADGNFGKLDPAPCLFTVRLRLGYLLMRNRPKESIALFRQVVNIDPLRLEVNALIGEAYEVLASAEGNADRQQLFYREAVAAYEAELSLSPVTPRTVAITGDEANNAHVHWALAAIHEKLGERDAAIAELQLYLKATKWHGDVYPWRIPLARTRIAQLTAAPEP
ncbi:MAG: hypothetical protein M3Z85_03460 [Acidobacteriota bacterium]|nr:hypothetical protein [Acidobacteriota bacterium]